MGADSATGGRGLAELMPGLKGMTSQERIKMVTKEPELEAENDSSGLSHWRKEQLTHWSGEVTFLWRLCKGYTMRRRQKTDGAHQTFASLPGS